MGNEQVAAMSEFSDDETQIGVLVAAKDAVYKPLSYATSKPAQRAYLSTALFFITSLFLLGIAITAYIFFYFSYIPTRGFSRPVYLQFNPNQYPYGNVALSRELVSYQPYDIKAVLKMPRTPSNINAGNFMLSLQLLRPHQSGGEDVLVQENRPATLTYRSNVMDHVHKAARLPLFVFGVREEAETLEVKLMERVEFSRGWKNIPATARLELQSEGRLHVYEAKIVFSARLKGLRYIMYNFRVASFLILTATFWIVEMAFTALIWLGFSVLISPQGTSTYGTSIKPETTPIKDDGDALDSLSDTPRTFPTRTGQPPLQYSSPHVKSEEEDEKPIDIHPPTAEADDEEDEDADLVVDEPGLPGRGFSDSGIGTSMESSAGKFESMRRRTSRTRDNER
ncbi:hypothetical protein EJ08DRAFT_621742 [Tothia fuscella]|uniref:Adipose-regulatory protein-domain-containing protein n=1 Tax=Tothia fuscella TaxID=1048955 RepID=A0A9P4TRZ1_9PEZI|nr:hypothetical protein EJ08DRAFT_621742 [Tothia fuscella]